MCVWLCVCVVVCLAVCMKEGSLVAARDLLTHFHFYAQECTQRRKKEKSEFRSMLDAVSPLGNCYSQAFHPKVHKCINTELCVLCARQNSGLQLACSALDYLNIEPQI